MAPVIHIINGPNLNLTGRRERDIYGAEELQPFLEGLKEEFADMDIGTFQSNHEGGIVDHIQDILNRCDGIIINPGAFTHTSVAIRDALAIHRCPVIEVHLSDIGRREEFRKNSYIRDLAWTHVEGRGLEGYRIALLRMRELIGR